MNARLPLPNLPASLTSGLAWITQIDFIRVIRRGWRYVAAACLVSLTLAGLYLAGSKRMYQATARLLVLQEGGPPMATAESSRMLGGDDYLPTHAAILKSPLVVSRAISELGIEKLPTIAAVRAQTGKDLVTAAIDELTISRPDRTAKIVCVDYRAGSREEATLMVGAIVASYEKFLADKYQKSNGDVVALIASARDSLRTELDEMQKKYLEFRRAHPTSTVDENGRSFMSRRLDQWDRAANEAMVREVQLRSQLELGQKLAKGGAGFWAVVHAMNQVGGGDPNLLAHATEPSMGGPADYVRQLGRDQQELAERFGPNYTKVRDIEDQINRIQQRTRESKGRLDRAEIGDLLGSVEKSIEAVQALRAEFTKRFDQDLSKAMQSEDDQLIEANLKENIQQFRNLFNTTVEHLKRAQLVGDYNAINAQVIEEPNALPRAVQPRIGLTLALALLLGLVTGGATAFLADRMDLTFRSAEDLGETLGLAVLGRVPVPVDASTIRGPFGLVARSAPFSPQAEAYRAVRTHIELMRRNTTLNVLLITSPHAGDGKSTTASNLAIGLAHAGRKVLLIDADLRRPTLHTVHGLPRDSGLAQVLLGTMSIRRATRPSTERNLDLMVAGGSVSNPSELLMSPRLDEMLATLRTMYDIVIIDSSPLLAVTDAAILGSVADGVILVARPSTLRRGEADRMRELLRGLDKPLIGLVVNRVDAEQSAYGYAAQAEDAAASSDGDSLDDDLNSGEGLSAHMTNGYAAMQNGDHGPTDLMD